MSKILTTFSGKYGDIMWALPTVKAIAGGHGKVDFGIMPEYKSLLRLLSFQSYIDKAFVIENWACTGSPHGDQPWQPPADAETGYEKSFHLTYRCHPGIHGPAMPLINFTAYQQGIVLENPIPFIETPVHKLLVDNEDVTHHIAHAFSVGATELKLQFMDELMTKSPKSVAWVDVSKEEWLDAACLIKSAVCFVGSRSSNNVIAHGVGQKNIFIYEPEASRHASGQFGKVFGSPYTEEITAFLDQSPEQAAEMALAAIRIWLEQKQEVV